MNLNNENTMRNTVTTTMGRCMGWIKQWVGIVTDTAWAGGCRRSACWAARGQRSHGIKIRVNFLGKKQNPGNSNIDDKFVLEPGMLDHPQHNDDELERVNKELKYIKTITKKVIGLEKQSITFNYGGNYNGFCVFDLT